MKVTLAKEDVHEIEAIRAMCDNERLTRPSLNGAQIDVTQGEFTAVDGPDELVAAQLLQTIHNLLAETRGES